MKSYKSVLKSAFAFIDYCFLTARGGDLKDPVSYDIFCASPLISDEYFFFLVLISNTVRDLLFLKLPLWWIMASLAGKLGKKTAAWHPVTGRDWHRGSSSSEGEVKLTLEITWEHTKNNLRTSVTQNTQMFTTVEFLIFANGLHLGDMQTCI